MPGPRITFFNRSGAVLASSAPEPAAAVGIPRAVGNAIASPHSFGQSERGDTLYVAVAEDDIVVRLAAPMTAIHATMHVLRRDLLIVSLIAVALATILAAFLAHRGAARLERIVVFANRIAAGDFSARVEEGPLDEISGVAHALDATAARLEASFRALESKQRELTALLDSMQEAVIAVNAASRISWSNSVMQRIAPGATRPGQALVHAVRDPEVLACVETALNDREPRSGRATSVAPNRVFEVNAAPTPDGGAVAVLHDVTEIERRREDPPRFHRQRLARAAHPAHLHLRLRRNPPRGHPRNPRPRPRIPRHHPQERPPHDPPTEDLLALASVESGDYKVKLRPVSASILVQDAIESLTGMVLDSDVTLESAGATDARVLADEDALTQVFGNLIENAMKYGKAGKRVLVGARELDGCVEFSVQDFGPGIGSEHLNRIFERFYRVDKARSRESGGTGLGLAIAKHIVLAHGGAIRVESELADRGATFLFTLSPRLLRHPCRRKRLTSHKLLIVGNLFSKLSHFLPFLPSRKPPKQFPPTIPPRHNEGESL